MKDEWDFEQIMLPSGCWVDSRDGYVMLPGGDVVGKLTPIGLEALLEFLDDLKRFAPSEEEHPNGQNAR